MDIKKRVTFLQPLNKTNYFYSHTVSQMSMSFITSFIIIMSFVSTHSHTIVSLLSTHDVRNRSKKIYLFILFLFQPMNQTVISQPLNKVFVLQVIYFFALFCSAFFNYSQIIFKYIPVHV